MKNTINMLIVISIFMVSCDDSSSTASTAVICGANEYVSSNACVACAAGTVNESGDDSSGADTSCETECVSTDLAGTWRLAPEANALMVGPEPNEGTWWANSAADVDARACLFDDEYVFGEDGSFNNELGSETWLEGWQGVAEGCGAPVAPHDGSADASYAYDDATVTVYGTGAFLGLAKVYNGGECSSPDDAAASITYDITLSDNDETMTVLIHFGGGYWTFKLKTAESIDNSEIVWGCLDSNATNYDETATDQLLDQWGNLMCTYASCDDVPYEGCMYADSFAGWNEFFGPDDCTTYGGTPCEGGGDLSSVVTFDLDGLDGCGFVSVTGTWDGWSGWGAHTDSGMAASIPAGDHEFIILCVNTEGEWWNDIWGSSTVYNAPIDGSCWNGNSEYPNYVLNVDGSGDAVTVSYCAGSCDATCSDPVVSGCLDPNATNYDPDATDQLLDQYGNLVCIYASCDDVPYDGCMYADAFAGWFPGFGPVECTMYGGTPCEESTTATVEFSADMNSVDQPSADYDSVVINGSWNGWGGWGVQLFDDDGDGVFTGSAEFDALSSFEYVVAVTGAADGWSGWGMQWGQCDGTNFSVTVGAAGSTTASSSAPGDCGGGDLSSVVTFDIDGVDDCGFVSINGSFPDDAGATWSGWGAHTDNGMQQTVAPGSYEFQVLCVDTSIPNWWDNIGGASTVLTAPLGSECDFNPADEWNNYGFTVDGSGDAVTVSYCAGSCDADCPAADPCADVTCADGQSCEHGVCEDIQNHPVGQAHGD